MLLSAPIQSRRDLALSLALHLGLPLRLGLAFGFHLRLGLASSTHLHGCTLNWIAVDDITTSTWLLRNNKKGAGAPPTTSMPKDGHDVGAGSTGAVAPKRGAAPYNKHAETRHALPRQHTQAKWDG